MLVAAPLAALAAEIYVNGVRAEGVKNQVFVNARVEFDVNGNVIITVPPAAPAATPAPTPAPPAVTAGLPIAAGRFWLVTEKASPGLTQYDLELFVNGKWVRRFMDAEEHVVFDLSPHLRTGDNKVLLLAKKSLIDGRRSQSPQHFFRVVVGEGQKNGRNVMITKKLIDYQRTALETQDFTNEYTLTVK